MFCPACGQQLPQHAPWCAHATSGAAQPAPGLGSTIAASILLGPFGAIWAKRNADAAQRLGYGGQRYWTAFLVSWLGTAAAVVAVSLLSLVFVASFKGSSETLFAGPSPLGTLTTTSECSYPPSGTPVAREVPGRPPAVPARKQVTAVLHTNRGDITLVLDGTVAPCTVNSFGYLAEQHYFDGTPCHRLTTQGIYVVQCGDPSGRGDGGPGYVFDDELRNGTTYPRGTVAMANSGNDTNGSQFFLVYKDIQLDPNYTVFGTVTEGLDILTDLAAGGTTPPADGRPNLPLTITAVTIS